MRRTAALALALSACVAPERPAPPAAVPVAPPPPMTPVAEDFDLTGPMTQGGLLHGRVPAAGALTLDGRPVRVADDRRFVVAFDRDAGPVAVLRLARAGQADRVRTIAVAPRAWNIESLPIPRGTSPDPAFQRMRAAELARIAAARAIASDSDGWRHAFHWPAIGRISGLFGSQRVYRGEKGAYHSGTDIARPTGTPVAAPADGVVVLAADAPFSLEGRLLMIDHGMGLNSSFLHLSRIDVAVGDRVRRGQTVGAIGMTGRATGPHLHWSVKWQDARIDPSLLTGPMPTD